MLPRGQLVDLGGFREFVFDHDVARFVTFEFGAAATGSDPGPWLSHVQAEMEKAQASELGLELILALDEAEQSAGLKAANLSIDGIEAGPVRHMAARYSQTLEWFVGCIASHSRHTPGNIRIITGVLPQPSKDEIDTIQAALERWRSRIAEQYVVSLSIEVRAERSSPGLALELEHARYLITDQAAVTVDRGFDLLRPTESSDDKQSGARRLRDLTVTRLRHWSGIEDAASSWPLLAHLG